MHRVAVTGVGVICAIGHNADDFCRSLREGRSGIMSMEAVNPALFRFKNAAEVRNYSPQQHFNDSQCDLMDRFAQFAVIAAREAVEDSGVDWVPALLEETTIITGSCVGGQNAQDRGFFEIYQRGRNRVHPMTIPRTMANAGASHISMDLGITGPTYTISTACSSATHAIGQAFWAVRSGSSPLAITGGSEAPFSTGILRAWESLRVISADTCRPFSLNRRGMILGEGAAMMVLERRDLAEERGARIYGEIVGFGMSSDAGHITQPTVEGPKLAMLAALRDANLDKYCVEYINAHGTGTPVNDSNETRAIREVFEKHAERLAISSSKSMHGHALGAAGALEASATLLSMHHGFLPPTVNYTESDPDCDLDVIPNEARAAQLNYAMSNSFAFGGLNAVLVFHRP